MTATENIEFEICRLSEMNDKLSNEISRLTAEFEHMIGKMFEEFDMNKQGMVNLENALETIRKYREQDLNKSEV